jgi:hypothetical protein
VISILAKFCVSITSISVAVAILFQALADPSAGTVISAIGYPTVMVILWRISRNLKALNDFQLMYRIEHQILMEWWTKETGQERPAQALSMAKKVGM